MVIIKSIIRSKVLADKQITRLKGRNRLHVEVITVSDSEAKDLERSLLTGSSIHHKHWYWSNWTIKQQPNSCFSKIKASIISLAGLVLVNCVVLLRRLINCFDGKCVEKEWLGKMSRPLIQEWWAFYSHMSASNQLKNLFCGGMNPPEGFYRFYNYVRCTECILLWM